MKPVKKGAIIGALITGVVLIVILVVPELHNFVYRNPVPRLFTIGSFIWWMTYAIIPPILAAQLVVIIITLGIGVLTGAAAGHLKKQKFAAGTVILTGLVMWFALLFWLGSSMMHAH